MVERRLQTGCFFNTAFMTTDSKTTFFSYARADAEFVLKLATDLRQAGASVWLDQLDIKPGARWDAAIETALHAARHLIVVLSPSSVSSNNVMDEVSYALENGKSVIPVLISDCTIPFRLKRLQYIDFTTGYEPGLARLLAVLDSRPTGEFAENNAQTAGSSPAIAAPEKSAAVVHPSAQRVAAASSESSTPAGWGARQKENTSPLAYTDKNKPARRKYLTVAIMLALALVSFFLIRHFADGGSTAEAQTTVDTSQQTGDVALPVEVGAEYGGGYFIGIDSLGQYLIAAPEDMISTDFQDSLTNLSLENQVQTLNRLSNIEEFGGFTDWRVPETHELLMLYEARKQITGLQTEENGNAGESLPDYFAASVYDDHTVLYKNFANGTEGYYASFTGGRIRPVRTFQKKE